MVIEINDEHMSTAVCVLVCVGMNVASSMCGGSRVGYEMIRVIPMPDLIKTKEVI